MIGRVASTAGVFALIALAFAGCGSGEQAVRVQTTSPAAFVESVRQLVQPAERMGVIATTALSGEGAQASNIEVDGVVDDITREVREFGALHLSDPALTAEQRRLLAAIVPIVATMRQMRGALKASGKVGLKSATSQLLIALRGIPSAAQPSS